MQDEKMYTSRCFGCSWAATLTVKDLFARAQAHFGLIACPGPVIAVDLDTNSLVTITSVVKRTPQEAVHV